MEQGATLGEVREKRQWDSVLEFILTCVSMSVGLGNFWRFPYECYKHGGGAFMLPYLIVLVIIGRPMYYLDLSLGQFSGKGTMGLYYKLAPAWLGLGISQTSCCFSAMSYYAHILAITMWYFIHSFTTELPWTVCDPEWGDTCIDVETSYSNTSSSAMSSSESYLYRTVLRAADDVDNGLGTPDWRLTLCLFVVWVMAFGYVSVGIKSTGKLAYFTALFPYVVLIVLLIRSCCSEGAMNGVVYLFNPRWHLIAKPEIWVAATSQLFFTLGIGYGTVAMYASFNPFNCNIISVAYIITVVDTLTSILCGITIFTGIGNLAYRLDVTVEDVIKGSGMSLGFVSYPDAIARFEQVPYIFAAVFFLMFFTLGLGSLCSFQQVLSTNIMEIWPVFNDWQAGLITATLGFVSGIIYTTPGGQAMVELVDLFGNVYLLMVNAIVMVVLVFYVYGTQNYCWDLEFMHKKPASKFYLISSAIFTFLAMVIIYLYGCFQDGWIKINGRPVPLLMMICGYILLAVGSLPIPLTVLSYVIKYHREGMTWNEAFKKTFSNERWMPNNEDLIAQIKVFRQQKLEAYPLKGQGAVKRFLYALVKNY